MQNKKGLLGLWPYFSTDNYSYQIYNIQLICIPKKNNNIWYLLPDFSVVCWMLSSWKIFCNFFFWLEGGVADGLFLFVAFLGNRFLGNNFLGIYLASFFWEDDGRIYWLSQSYIDDEISIKTQPNKSTPN